MPILTATPITALYAGLLAILVVVLGFRVVQARIREQVSLGDGGNKKMLAAIRIHGNATETIPLALLLMLVLELNGSGNALLHGCGVALVFGRFTHAFGLLQQKTVNHWRKAGMVLTWLATLVMAVALLVKAVAGVG